MKRIPVCSFALAACLLVMVLPAVLCAQTPDNAGPAGSVDVSRPHPLTNDSVLRMTKAGLEDALIISTIRTQPGHYNLGVDDVIALRSAGVSAPVIEAMQARDSGLHRHVAETATGDGSSGTYSPTGTVGTLPSGVDEIGVYYRDHDGNWQMLPVERVNFKSSGWLKNALSDGILKQDMNGHLEGPHASLSLSPGEEFLIYAPPGTQGEEYDLLRLEGHNSSREFRTSTGGIFHSSTGSARNEISVTPHRIAPRLYVFTMPTDIELGEYGVLPPGSSNTQGISGTGKIFTFALVNSDRPAARPVGAH